MGTMLKIPVMRLYATCFLLILMMALDCCVVRELGIRRDLSAMLCALGRPTSPVSWCRMYGPLTRSLQETRNVSEALSIVKRLPKARIIRERPDSLIFSLQFGQPSWSGLFSQEVDVDVAWDRNDTLVRIDRTMAFH